MLANVIPIYKKDVRESPGNYRPVSLTSVPGKVAEKITLGTVRRHLKDNAIPRHSQHRLTKGKSCLTNFISFYYKVTHLVDEGKMEHGVFLDLSQGFHAVPHSILLHKLSSCGMNGFMVRWLKDKVQRVAVGLHLDGQWSPVVFLTPHSCGPDLFNMSNLDAGLGHTISWWHQPGRCCWHSWGTKGFAEWYQYIGALGNDYWD